MTEGVVWRRTRSRRDRKIVGICMGMENSKGMLKGNHVTLYETVSTGLRQVFLNVNRCREGN